MMTAWLDGDLRSATCLQEHNLHARSQLCLLFGIQVPSVALQGSTCDLEDWLAVSQSPVFGES